MDNLTHTLIGYVVGEAIHRGRSPRALDFQKEHREELPATPSSVSGAPSRVEILLASILGNNLPDCDFVLPWISGKKLDYLLHHRGHTHTFLGAAVLVGVLFLGAMVMKRSRAKFRRLLILSGVCLLGTFLHILADSWNSYGVHPFWPWDNRWYYGDSIFIIEPLILFALIPFAILSSVTRLAAAVWVSLGLITAGLCVFTGWVPVPILVGLLFFTIAVTALYFRLGARRWGPLLPVAFCALIVLSFWQGSRAIDRRIQRWGREFVPEATAAQVVLSPYPVNPFCWSYIAVIEKGDEYRLLRGTATLGVAPSFCPDFFKAQITAPQIPVPEASASGLFFAGQFVGSISERTHLSEVSCEFALFLQFSRAPFWIVKGNTLMFGDLRYDRERNRGFAEFEVPIPHSDCKASIPWVAPVGGRRGVLPSFLLN